MARLAKAWQYLIFTALVGVLLAFLAWTWFESFDLRAHGVRTTGRVEQLAHSRALLRLPGPTGRPEDVWVDVPYHQEPKVGSDLEVIYDPARPVTNTRGHRIDYADPVFFTVLAIFLPAAAWLGHRRMVKPDARRRRG